MGGTAPAVDRTGQPLRTLNDHIQDLVDQRIREFDRDPDKSADCLPPAFVHGLVAEVTEEILDCLLLR